MIHAFAFGLAQLYSNSAAKKESIFFGYGSTIYALQWFIHSKGHIRLSEINGEFQFVPFQCPE